MQPEISRVGDPKPDYGEASYRGSGRLLGRKALITGGMGSAAAIAYAREGADVVINHFPTEEPDAREVIQLVKQAGRNGFPIPGDLRDESFCQRLVAQALEKLGALDIVVCNAGRQQARASILDVITGDFDATMKTNVYPPSGSLRPRYRTCSRGRRSSERPRNWLPIPRPTCTTMPRPRLPP